MSRWLEPISEEGKTLLLNWAKSNFFNVEKYEFDALHKLAGEKFLQLRSAEGILGVILVLRFSDNLASIPVFVVFPPHTRKGHGNFLLRNALPNDCKEIRCYSRSARIEGWCNTLGFEPVFEAECWKYPLTSGSYFNTSSENMRKITPKSIGDIKDYEIGQWGQDRVEYLKMLLENVGSKGYYAVKDGKIKGYGIVRQCVKNYRAGPLYADDPRTAKMLVDALISEVPPGQAVFFNIPRACNKHSEQLINHLKLQRDEEGDMLGLVKGECTLKIENCYSVASLELA